MTLQEAKQALHDGMKVRHRFFSPYEYIYIDEDGFLHDEMNFVVGSEFWESRSGETWRTGWSIYNN